MTLPTPTVQPVAVIRQWKQSTANRARQVVFCPGPALWHIASLFSLDQVWHWSQCQTHAQPLYQPCHPSRHPIPWFLLWSLKRPQHRPRLRPQRRLLDQLPGPSPPRALLRPLQLHRDLLQPQRRLRVVHHQEEQPLANLAWIHHPQSHACSSASRTWKRANV